MSTIDKLKRMKPRAVKAAEKRVDRAYYASCSGIQVNIMDLGKVNRAGVALIAVNPGIEDKALEAAMKEIVLAVNAGRAVSK